MRRHHAARRAWPSRSSTKAATPPCGRPTNRADAPGGSKTSRNWSTPWQEFETLGGFLEHIALVMDRDTGEAEDAVSIMTLHGAKGLEFDTVFLPGLGGRPVSRASARWTKRGRAGLEEERRLAYVGITRARKRLRLSWRRTAACAASGSRPSRRRFLDELPPERGRGEGHRLAYGGYGYGGRTVVALRQLPIPSTASTRPPAGSAPAPRPTTAKSPGPIDHRRRPRRPLHRRRPRLQLFGRRAGLPPEIRLRPDRPGRRQQALDRFRKSRPEEGARQLCEQGVNDDWAERVDDLWARYDDLDPDDLLARFKGLAAERPPDDPLALSNSPPRTTAPTMRPKPRRSTAPRWPPGSPD